MDVVETETPIIPEVGKKRKLEDSIPVIEIRGEGQPMTAAQIRQLEEMSNGGPLDIKVKDDLFSFNSSFPNLKLSYFNSSFISLLFLSILNLIQKFSFVSFRFNDYQMNNKTEQSVYFVF